MRYRSAFNRRGWGEIDGSLRYGYGCSSLGSVNLYGSRLVSTFRYGLTSIVARNVGHLDIHYRNDNDENQSGKKSKDWLHWLHRDYRWIQKKGQSCWLNWLESQVRSIFDAGILGN